MVAVHFPVAGGRKDARVGVERASRWARLRRVVSGEVHACVRRLPRAQEAAQRRQRVRSTLIGWGRACRAICAAGATSRCAGPSRGALDGLFVLAVASRMRRAVRSTRRRSSPPNSRSVPSSSARRRRLAACATAPNSGERTGSTICCADIRWRSIRSLGGTGACQVLRWRFQTSNPERFLAAVRCALPCSRSTLTRRSNPRQLRVGSILLAGPAKPARCWWSGVRRGWCWLADSLRAVTVAGCASRG